MLGSCRDVEDAFAVSDEEQNEETFPGRSQKTKQKQQKDPALLQAEQILEAGHHAINMNQG